MENGKSIRQLIWIFTKKKKTNWGTFFPFSCSNGFVCCLYFCCQFHHSPTWARVHRFRYFFTSTFAHIPLSSGRYGLPYKSVRFLYCFPPFPSHSMCGADIRFCCWCRRHFTLYLCTNSGIFNFATISSMCLFVHLISFVHWKRWRWQGAESYRKTSGNQQRHLKTIQQNVCLVFAHWKCLFSTYFNALIINSNSKHFPGTFNWWGQKCVIKTCFSAHVQLKLF